MEEGTSTKKILFIFGSVIITTVLLFGGIFFLVSSPSSSSGDVKGTATQQGNSQVLEISAKAGYLPKVSTALANRPIVLKVNTKDTYDCSSGFSIPKLGINKQLPSNGLTEIQIPAQTAGTTINFTCSMGMYSGQIKIS